VKPPIHVEDRLGTDIRFGNEDGMTSLLVMIAVIRTGALIGLGQASQQEPLTHCSLPDVRLVTGNDGN
jgi:ribonucleotide monophosphatase NagD (HAD superfamily)